MVYSLTCQLGMLQQLSMSDILQAKIEITVEQLDQLRAMARDAEARAAAAEARAAQLAVSDPDGRLRKFADVIENALPIVSFAVSNLDPTITKGWPYRALFDFGAALLDMPGVTSTVREYAMEFQAVARGMEPIEIQRGRTPAKLGSEAIKLIEEKP